MSLKSSYISRAAGALFVTIAAVVGVHEGRSLVAYYDSANVLTICDGDTRDVKPGQKATPAECDDRLRKGIADHAKALDGLPEGLPDVVVLGSVDLSYNIGVYGFRGSEVYAQLMLRNYNAAANAVLRWRYISQSKAPAPAAGWVYSPASKKWRFDCSQILNGAPNKVCYGLWKRRLWQSQAIGNQFKSLQEAVTAVPK
jgi:GH24 family phage-related lysozyme (muramidase)